MSRRELISLILKGLMAWLTLSSLVWYFGGGLATLLFPLLKAVISTLMPEISPGLKLVQVQLDYALELSARTLRPIYLNADHFILPGTEMKSSIHLLHALVPLVIEGIILLVWPVQRGSQRCLLLALGFLTAVLLIMATLPTHFLGQMEISFHNIAVTGSKPRPVLWLVEWMVFCEMGGRWLLGIVAACLCIQAQRELLRD